MTRLIKRILYKLLGQAAYLKLLHRSFFILYDLGFLKNNHNYKYHHFVKNLISPGDVVVDIGANLGYFSKIFSRLIGKNGKVICIEPVKPFFNVLQWALKEKKNCDLYNYALGLENKKIEMILPKMGGYLRTGLAHIPEDKPDPKNVYSFEVEMIKGSSLLKDQPRINYIKCDIEGYEEYVLPELKEIIEKHKPLLQVETWGTHKEKVFHLMLSLGYIQYGVYKNKLVKNLTDDVEAGDYLFIHEGSIQEILKKLNSLNRL